MSRPRGYLARALYEKYNNDSTSTTTITRSGISCRTTARKLMISKLKHTFEMLINAYLVPVAQISREVLRPARARPNYHAVDFRVKSQIVKYGIANLAHRGEAFS